MTGSSYLPAAFSLYAFFTSLAKSTPFLQRRPFTTSERLPQPRAIMADFAATSSMLPALAVSSYWGEALGGGGSTDW
eukprot:CAMPEP_0175346044 /NCGR_PEP_ID=MMETSP0095-20121207/8672_1 /TAXON_ID=311494 /ORGANISM="Alexandrium monilatum, Strain CCMP3105" /LENGTH=76 /DNA_ID=CAMNT_0016643515 /DNA_START=166 /DNA_END=393 /DNA_ORIENTATION=-